MSNEPLPQSEIILYQTEDGRTRIQCRFENETLWLTQALIAELFQVTVPTVNEHLKGIYAEGELAAGATIRKFRIVRLEGRRQVTREIEHYHLPKTLSAPAAPPRAYSFSRPFRKTHRNPAVGLAAKERKEHKRREMPSVGDSPGG